MEDVSVIIPVHNGAAHLQKAVSGIAKKLEEEGVRFEIVIAEDASEDGSDRIAQKLSGGSGQVLLSQSKEKRGRGRALKEACSLCSGKKIIYMDVDLATDLGALGTMISLLEKNEVAIGSRYANDASARRAPLRLVFSKCYIFLVNLLTGAGITDYQCGFKGFQSGALRKLMAQTKDSGWFWDTEVLLAAKKDGMRIAEIPVRWEESGDSTVRVFSDAVVMGRALLNHVFRKDA
jgi:glycosyltransferase AglD